MNSILTDHLHSSLTVFPSATLTLALLFECWVVFYRQSTMRLVVLVLVTVGTLGVIAAFVSGYVAAEGADRFFLVPDEAISTHHETGRFLLFGSIAMCGLWWIARFAKVKAEVFQCCARVLLVVVVGLCAYTAFLGGELVQHYGAGVHATGAVINSSTAQGANQ